MENGVKTLSFLLYNLYDFLRILFKNTLILYHFSKIIKQEFVEFLIDIRKKI